MGIDSYTPGTGRKLKEDGTTANIADLIEAIAETGVKLTGSIVEYAWLDGAAEPTPTEAFAWGYKLNATTGVLTTYGWTGTSWVEVV